MADQLQLRGGTTTEHSTFTGALREVTVDTDKDTLIVHDAATAGGHPLLREDGSNSALSLGTAGTPSIKFTGDTNTGIYSPGADQVAISTNGQGRLFVDASGRVGINKAIPSQTLQVVSATGGTTARFENTSSGNFVDFYETTGGTRMGYIGHTSATDMYIHNDKAGPLVFDTNNTERLRIDSSGRLLVGTSSSSGNPLLVVQSTAGSASGAGWLSVRKGNVPSAANQNIGVIQFDDSSGNAGAYVYTVSDGAWTAGSSHPTRLVFSTTADGASSPTERMRIDSSGRVGVGTTSPSSTLHVTGDSTFTGDIISGSSGFFYDHSTGKLAVGIGTPGSTRLHVKGHSSLNNSLLVDVNSGDSTLGFAENGTEKWRIENVTSDDALRFFDVTNTSERLRIDNSGRVGIGTSSPQRLLSLESDGSTYQIIIRDNDLAATGAYWQLGNVNGSFKIASTTHPSGYLTSVVDRLVIDSSGNVGIGTTTVDSLLHLYSSSAGGVRLTIQDSATGTTSSDGYIQGVDSSKNGYFFNRESAALYFGTANTERARIDSSGRLLVGTSTSREVTPNGGAGHITSALNVIERTGNAGLIFVTDYNALADVGSCLSLARTRSTSVGGNSIVQNGDLLGTISFAGADGTDINSRAAEIYAEVDGTPGSNDMPGRLVFSTTADGASSPTERMRITSDAYVRLASGTGGIQFNGDTAAANALDDYEEGTWTPGISDGVNTGSVTAISCRYTKIGRFVYVRGTLLNIDTTGLTAGNNLGVTGLPYALQPNVTNSDLAFPVATTNITTTKGLAAGISRNSTSFLLYEVDNAVFGATPVKVSALTSGSADILIGFSYEAA